MPFHHDLSGRESTQRVLPADPQRPFPHTSSSKPFSVSFVRVPGGQDWRHAIPAVHVKFPMCHRSVPPLVYPV